MRVLVTGAFGFVGRHVIAELRRHGHPVCGYDLGAVPPEFDGIDTAKGDVRDATALREAVRRARPEACLHLAALAFVPSGASSPEAMLDVNVMGTIRLLEAFRQDCPEARLLVVSSAQVYGHQPRQAPVKENEPFAPDSIYAVTKAAADTTALLYARQYGLNVAVVRPHNHIGPGQAPLYVVPAFARQVARIARGAPPEIRVGNLESRRDFTDVRDVARAYRLLLDRARGGEAYNLGSGAPVAAGDILRRLCSLAGIQPRIVRDETLFRPNDRSPVLDVGKLREATGWTPEIPLDRTLKDILDSVPRENSP